MNEDGDTLTKRATKKETDSWCTNLPTEKQLRLLDVLSELRKTLKKTRPDLPYPTTLDISKKFNRDRRLIAGYCRVLTRKGWVRTVGVGQDRIAYYDLTKKGKKVQRGLVEAETDAPTKIWGLCDGDNCYFVGDITRFKNKYLCDKCLLGKETPITLEDVMHGKNKSSIAHAEDHAILNPDDFADINKKAKKHGKTDPCNPWPLSSKARAARNRKTP